MSFLDMLSRADSLQIVIWSVFIGIVIGACSLYYNKRVIGSFVRALLRSGASGPDSARTLEELGYGKNIFVKHALRDGSVLRKMVWEADDNFTTDASGYTFSARTKRMDINTAHFYVDESNRIKVDLRYSAKGTDIITLLVGVIIFVVVAYALLLFIPYITDLFASVTAG
ncbi:MAG: hypothetical protein ACI3YK_01330 [Eubacteriales bacterium]